MKHLLAIIIAVLLIATAGCGASHPTPEEAAAPTDETTISDPSKLHAVSSMAFSQYFDANEVRALRVFGEDPLIMVGRVDRIAARANGPDVYLSGAEDDVVCDFAPEVAAEVELLTKGEMAAIAGIPFRATFGPGLKDCRVVPAEIKPAPGGYLEFREYEVAYLQQRLADLQPLKEAAAKLADLDHTARNISKSQEIQAEVATYERLLSAAQAELDAARNVAPTPPAE